MGKYMRKSKTTGEIAVMEISQSSLGVRTRAKALALQKLQKSPASSASSGSYLQLRSRRLEKPPIIASSHESKRQKQAQKEGCEQESRENTKPRASARLRMGSVVSGTVESVSLGHVNDKDGQNGEEVAKEMVDKNEEIQDYGSNEDGDDLGGEEASFGENFLDFEGRERSTRESTPCSLIRDPDSIRTPGSTTRPTRSTRMQSLSHRDIPTALEMDEFFASAEKKLQRQFIEKYNFDPVKDKPLPGRYEWEKLEP